MVKQEGVTSLRKVSSVHWAMIVRPSQLASYDQIKETILAKVVMEDGVEACYWEFYRKVCSCSCVESSDRLKVCYFIVLDLAYQIK